MRYLCAALCWVLVGCAQIDAADGRKDSVVKGSRTTSSEFDRIELGNFMQSDCSPRFSDRTAVGVQINMPDRVTIPLDEVGRLPLCITAQLKAAEVAKYRHMFRPANIVVVDDERGETWTASLWKDRTFRDPPPLAMSEEEMEVVTITKFYNVNVLEYLDLPRRNATYYVYVTLNAHKSNVLTVEVKTP